MFRSILSLLILLTITSRTFAWSSKEHILLTRLAAQRLIADPATPEPMKQWLQSGLDGVWSDEQIRRFVLAARVGPFGQGASGLLYWSVYPDLVAGADRHERKVEPFGVTEAKLHYLDVELFSPDPARRKYLDDLSAKPAADQFPRSRADERYARAGMLPFTIEHFHKELVKNLRQHRLNDKPGQFPRDEHAMRYAGCLAHYVQDNFQPQHATEDYKSRSYFPKIEAKKSPDVHADMEYRLVDDELADYPELRQEYVAELSGAVAKVQDQEPIGDVWKQSLLATLSSYDALPLIGRAAQAAYPDASGDAPGKWDAGRFFHYRGTYLGGQMTVMEMKAQRQAAAVVRLARLWRSAWDEAAREP